ncbi:MAG: cyclic pyranopterin monophosphate synthase MoaC [Candidatus Nanopelagicales bacterium]
MTEEPAAPLTHLDADGRPRMVDVSAKPITNRVAVATGCVRVSPAAAQAVAAGRGPKGDVLAVARIAGIQAAKRTWELVPLCHPVAITGIDVAAELDGEVIRLEALVRTADRTGIEMEALTAVAVAGLTVVDMVKAVDPGATIESVRVERKAGGAGGEWRRPT